MKVYNTLTNKKEDFIIDNNVINMYVCGPTVYDFIHIGNARPYVVFDTIRKYLEYKGFEVRYAQNFTDVDDKIINKANQEGVNMEVISDRYIKEALKDAKALNVKEPTFMPRVTEEIKEIIAMIENLVENNYAYEVDGTVFFNTANFGEYGKLSGKNLDELQIGARIEHDTTKKNTTDFVLWKPKKEGEPFWESSWGSGRPGWHIECSVMAKKYLGEQIDIHAGGEDLIFPHHENEIAQSECANGKNFAKYWLHNGFINVDNEKMAKSKGNFFTVRDIAKEIPYDVIRFFIISTHYKAPINFSKEALESSKKGLDRIKNCLKNLEYYLENNVSDVSISDEEQEILKSDVAKYKEYFVKEMDNDFNTANAITAIFELVRVTNSNTNENSSKEFMESLLNIFKELTGVLGIIYEVEAPSDLNDVEDDNSDSISEDEIQDLINKRQEAKAEKNYKLADEIRDDLKSKGIMLEDTSAGVRWSRG